MSMEKTRQAFIQASKMLVEKETELSDLDAKTGDGDHGVTAAKIGKAIIRAAEQYEGEEISEFFYCIFDEIMMVNGGSVAPLWALMADGAAQAFADETKKDVPAVRKAFEGALMGIREVSKAKAGEKTLADPLCAAIGAVSSGEGDSAELLGKAAEAALEAAEATRSMPAKFGRAKNLPDKGVGFLDPGAVSLAWFINELSRSYKEATV